MTNDQSTHDRDRMPDRPETDIDRRTFIAAGGTVGATMLAGCASDGSPTGDSGDEPSDDDETTEEATAGANFRLLISDQPADIGDFDRLDVSFDEARIFDGGGEESGDDEDGEGDGEDGSDGETENGDESAPEGGEDGGNSTSEDEETATEDGTETEDGDEPDDSDGDDSDGSGGEGVERRRGFYWLDLEGATVDLTKVVGKKAISVFDGGLSEGTYQKIELHVADVEGVVDGEVVDVKVPSEKLQITHSFEVSADEPLEFVFDINVVKRGPNNGYILKPVISESGVAGKDVDVEEVGADDESEDGEDGSEENGPEDDSDGGDADGDSDADAGDANESDANA
ncbi:DUF4382 domain-containing protein [Haloterrigena alkaliphila]|uniref:DUF4382 domain-containing protein n=1 Tax=Haloterrigena alkaliphila TaxID=2816475 RepID=A0A8A2VCD2_9EURY|nr:DUF4382 domain-containing protein [Haloterrigena alkaliphila]QSW98062.1 DUF4382 domain-containing protein [Haloterrigena alkaliphila]